MIRKQVEYRNFYNWYKWTCEDAGYADNYKQLWQQFTQDEVLNHHVAELILWIYKDSSIRDALPIYDAILVDED